MKTPLSVSTRVEDGSRWAGKTSLNVWHPPPPAGSWIEQRESQLSISTYLSTSWLCIHCEQLLHAPAIMTSSHDLLTLKVWAQINPLLSPLYEVLSQLEEKKLKQHYNYSRGFLRVCSGFWEKGNLNLLFLCLLFLCLPDFPKLLVPTCPPTAGKVMSSVLFL